jgi:hypothetical protein
VCVCDARHLFDNYNAIGRYVHLFDNYMYTCLIITMLSAGMNGRSIASVMQLRAMQIRIA